MMILQITKKCQIEEKFKPFCSGKTFRQINIWNFMYNLSMRYLIYIIIGLCSLSLMSKDQGDKTLFCLGQEEVLVHRTKDNGPQYMLNQRMISEFAQIKSTSIKEPYISNICKSKTTSLRILQLLIEHKNNLFSPSTLSLYEKSLQDSSIETLIERAPAIFLNHVAQVQGTMPTANCLEKYIPELAKIREDFKYLQTHLTPYQIIKSENRYKKILEKLEDLRQIRELCKKDLKKSKTN